MSETRSEQERSDTWATVAGFVILGAIFYFAVVFWQLPDDDRWWIHVLLLDAGAIMPCLYLPR